MNSANALLPTTLRVIDSHTGGEPTRVLPLGEVELFGATMQDRLEDMRSRVDHLRTGVLLEPRGSEVLVGAVLTPAVHEGSTSGVIFFNNAGYLGMCGHGTIGVVETLRDFMALPPGIYRLDTPVGTVTAELLETGEIAVQNVPAKRLLKDVQVNVYDHTFVTGDVAYGGNWFFISEDSPILLELRQEPLLRAFCSRIKDRLAEEGITGIDGKIIDHIELTGPPRSSGADSVNYVLCPGNAYDRSPCGTGTSAKLACLFEDGLLSPGDWYTQESITGSRFRAKVDIIGGEVVPTIVGRAWITAKCTLNFQADDPLRWGMV
jgi:4-hydroxyproline epimerase